MALVSCGGPDPEIDADIEPDSDSVIDSDLFDEPVIDAGPEEADIEEPDSGLDSDIEEEADIPEVVYPVIIPVDWGCHRTFYPDEEAHELTDTSGEARILGPGLSRIDLELWGTTNRDEEIVLTIGILGEEILNVHMVDYGRAIDGFATLTGEYGIEDMTYNFPGISIKDCWVTE